VQRTYLALATLAVAAAGGMTELAAPLRWASAAPSRAPLAQQQQRSLARPSTAAVADPVQRSALTALPPSAPPPLPEPIATPGSSGQSPQIVALQVIPFTP
jgi:hypothetical protein